MADGAYCDFQQLDQSVISSLTNFTQRSASENFGEPLSSKTGPGFYSEYGPVSMAGRDIGMGMGMGLQSMAGSSHMNHELSGLNALATTAAGIFDHLTSSYPVKSEKNMPPTPPGSPDDPPDMHSMSGMNAEAMMAHSMLAKPVPMKCYSDKKVAQARDTMVSPSMMSPEAMTDPIQMNGASSPALARALTAIQSSQKRPRSEKKAIPEDLKDGKYYERRKRNNSAAKKSRDARKAREDEIAIRASYLEKENAILRAQVATLREEANSLRQLLLQKRSRH